VPAGRSRAILAVVMVGGFVTALDTFIVNIAIPTIHADLHTGFAAIELVVAGYIFTYAVLLVTGGRIGDRITPRRAFMWGVAVFTVASLACGLAPNVETLIGARVVQGLGAALLYPQVFAIIQLSFSGGARARALGILSGSNGLASILGQVLGGLLLRADLFGSSWRLLFLINVPVGIAGWFGAARVLPRERSVEAESSLDAGGVVLLTLWLALLVGPLVAGRDEGWPAWLLLCLAAAVPAFALFALHEQRLRRRNRAPLVDVSLFRTPSFVIGTVTALVLFAQAGGLFFVLTLMLQDGLGYSPLAAALVFVPLGLAYIVSTVSVSRIVESSPTATWRASPARPRRRSSPIPIATTSTCGRSCRS
jgi:EmrB/QacA subfamily drug resistance transporter